MGLLILLSVNNLYNKWANDAIVYLSLCVCVWNSWVSILSLVVDCQRIASKRKGISNGEFRYRTLSSIPISTSGSAHWRPVKRRPCYHLQHRISVALSALCPASHYRTFPNSQLHSQCLSISCWFINLTLGIEHTIICTTDWWIHHQDRRGYLFLEDCKQDVESPMPSIPNF